MKVTYRSEYEYAVLVKSTVPVYSYKFYADICDHITGTFEDACELANRLLTLFNSKWSMDVTTADIYLAETGELFATVTFERDTFDHEVLI